MNDPKENLADDKILILYILKKVNKPISYKELLELVISISDINYFDFRQDLDDLLENNYVFEYNRNDNQIIELTLDGSNALDLTIGMLPGILKLNVDSKFKENLKSIKEERSICAEYTPLSENEFLIKCKVFENDTTIFNLEINVGTKEIAKNIVDNWNNNADAIYPKILDILNK